MLAIISQIWFLTTLLMYLFIVKRVVAHEKTNILLYYYYHFEQLPSTCIIEINIYNNNKYYINVK